MVNRAIACIYGLFVAGAALALDVDDGHKALFAPAAANLPEEAQREIYSAMAIRLASDQRTFIDLQCEGGVIEDPLEVSDDKPSERDTSFCSGATYVVNTADLNGDGVPEVFVIGGNINNSGITGSSIWLFVRDAQGHYVGQLGFPAAGYKVLKTKHQGFADIQIGGRGFCESIWRWDGAAYAHHRNVPTQKGGCDHLPR